MYIILFYYYYYYLSTTLLIFSFYYFVYYFVLFYYYYYYYILFLFFFFSHPTFPTTHPHAHTLSLSHPFFPSSFFIFSIPKDCNTYTPLPLSTLTLTPHFSFFYFLPPFQHNHHLQHAPSPLPSFFSIFFLSFYFIFLIFLSLHPNPPYCSTCQPIIGRLPVPLPATPSTPPLLLSSPL